MLSITNLCKTYGSKTILENINIVFPDKKINFILGKNGVGKTTLYKCILDLETYAGTIETTDRMYCIYDEQPFYSNLSGFDNIALYTAMYHIEQPPMIDHSMLDVAQLKKKVKQYSYGQRKKLALLLVDILQPRILLLDEASNGLDYDTIKYLKDKLIQWKEDVTILVTGHQLDFYNTIVDNVFVLKAGNMIHIEDTQDRTLEDIYEKYL